MTLFPPRSFRATDRMPETETVDGVPRDFVRIAENGDVLMTAEGLGIQVCDYIRTQFPDEDHGAVLLHYTKGLLSQLVADGFTPEAAAIECEVFAETARARLVADPHADGMRPL